jgi:CheY-like chemotaxis protein
LGASVVTKPAKQSELWDAIITALHVPVLHEARPSAARKRSRAPRQPLRILLAEDNPVNQEVAVHLIERRGHSVIVAENGKQAIEALERHKFDLVLMDVQMPEMGGLEATKIIREKEKASGQHLPIIAMTAHAMQGDREKCIEAGMDGYLGKPIDPKTFLQTVEGIAESNIASEPVESEESKSARTALDREALLARFSGNRKLLRNIVRTFGEDCPRMMNRVRNALTTRDAVALADAAHALKGSIGNFGPSVALDTTREIEKLARQGKLNGAWEMYATLEDQIALLLPDLQTIGSQKSNSRRHARPHHSSGRKQ